MRGEGLAGDEPAEAVGNDVHTSPSGRMRAASASAASCSDTCMEW